MGGWECGCVCEGGVGWAGGGVCGVGGVHVCVCVCVCVEVTKKFLVLSLRASPLVSVSSPCLSSRAAAATSRGDLLAKFSVWLSLFGYYSTAKEQLNK